MASQTTKSDDAQIQTAAKMVAEVELQRLTDRVDGAIEDDNFGRALWLAESVTRDIRETLDTSATLSRVRHSLHDAQRLAKIGRAKDDITKERAENAAEKIQKAHDQLL